MLNNIQYLGFIQSEITLGNITQNLSGVRQQLRDLRPPENSLLVLPELWATGFAYDELAQGRDDWYSVSVSALTALCAEYNILLAGSLPFAAQQHPGQFYNRMCVVGPAGELGSVDKQFLFPGEEKAFLPSSNLPETIALDDDALGSLGCFVCYDLRFPDIARRLCQQNAGVLLCSAQWPKARILHWTSLLVARAIENQVFVVGCNGVGINGEIILGGNSLVISPEGDILSSGRGEGTAAGLVSVDWQLQQQVRGRFNTVAQNPRKGRALDKIMVPEDCVTLVARKLRLGQKVMYVRIDQGDLGLDEMEKLAAARAGGDVLVVGVDCARAAVIGSFGKLGIILKRYAALENIDMVFDVNLLDEAMEKFLIENCESFAMKS